MNITYYDHSNLTETNLTCYSNGTCLEDHEDICEFGVPSAIMIMCVAIIVCACLVGGLR